jgi:hypothetical protein
MLAIHSPGRLPLGRVPAFEYAAGLFETSFRNEPIRLGKPGTLRIQGKWEE